MASPQVADLDGDGWAEIVMVAEDKRLKIWRFDRRERRLKVIATSPPLPVGWNTYHMDIFDFFHMHLFDLDGDGRKEIVVTEHERKFLGLSVAGWKVEDVERQTGRVSGN
jgi:hypothetical protein